MGDRADEITTFDPMDTRADAFATGSLGTPSMVTGGFPTVGGDAALEGDPELADEGGDDDIEATRAQIEQTRAELGSTIDAIQQRLSPQALAEQAKDTVRDATIGKAETMISNAGDAAAGAVSNVGDSAKGFGDSLLTTVKQNPVPAALAGLGIGWLLMSSRKQSTQVNRDGNGAYRGYQAPSAYSYRTRDLYGTPQSHSYGDSSGVQHAASRVGDTAGQAVSQVQDAAGNVAGQVQDLTGNVVGQVQDTASQVGYQAQLQTQRVSGGFQEMLQTRPLAVAAGAIAVGVAVGLAIPETPQEDRLMGPARENLVEQAQQTVQETAQKVQNVAGQAVDAAKAGAQKENLV